MLDPASAGPAARSTRRGPHPAAGVMLRIHAISRLRGYRRMMRLLVDLNRCQSYGQCVFAAPEAFRMKHDESLEWDYQPPAVQEEKIIRAVHACPVRAISLQTDSSAQ